MNKKKLLSREEYERWMQSLPADRCLLCEPHEQIVLGASEFWYWIANVAPYWRYHTMLIPKRHIRDMAHLTLDEFADFQRFEREIVNHLVGLGLQHQDGRSVDQFIMMIRVREKGIQNGSTYKKPEHLHVHLIPDKEGVGRFILNESANIIDIEHIALPRREY